MSPSPESSAYESRTTKLSPNPFRVRVLSRQDQGCSGSLQWVHLGQVPKPVHDDCDHTFLEKPPSPRSRADATTDCLRIPISWRNRAGSVIFCGSGAFAAAHVLDHVCGVSRGILSAKGGDISFRTERATRCSSKLQVELSFRGTQPDLLQHLASDLWQDPATGICLLRHQGSLEDFRLDEWLQMYSVADIHGLCVFQLGDKGRGRLRYFCPWHGRPEDSATGSIHHLLTPLAAHLGSRESWTWTQASPAGGSLHSRLDDIQVFLSGETCLEPLQESRLPHDRQVSGQNSFEICSRLN